ncbi:MAG: ATP synthase F0 subunit B [Desulfobacteraceae bacterium]|nr:ATP synthase F0 subunit B [Desulfobacteraceae bacterium]
MITVIPDGSFVIQMINFLVLLWILNLVFFKPIRTVLIQRKEKITGLEDGVEKLAKEVVEKDNAFENGLKEARVKGLKEKETFIEEASGEEKEIIEKINKKAQAKLAEIKKQVAEETEKARAELEKDIENYAKGIGEKILGRAC